MRKRSASKIIIRGEGEGVIPTRRKPTHPGEILLEEFLKPMGISQSAFARHLGGTWTQSKVNAIVREKRGITEQVALDFADVFGTTPGFWLNLQNRYNLWFAMKNHKKVRRLPQFLGKTRYLAEMAA